MKTSHANRILNRVRATICEKHFVHVARCQISDQLRGFATNINSVPNGSSVNDVKSTPRLASSKGAPGAAASASSSSR